MKITDKINLNKMDFTDFEVVDIRLNNTSKSISIYLSGAWCLVNDKRIELGKGFLEIKQYESICITSYNVNNKLETMLSEDCFEQLRELCEIEINNNVLILKGFAKNTSNWLEFVVIGGEVLGEFADINSVIH